jgi:hypothetical protein
MNSKAMKSKAQTTGSRSNMAKPEKDDDAEVEIVGCNIRVLSEGGPQRFAALFFLEFSYTPHAGKIVVDFVFAYVVAYCPSA